MALNFFLALAHQAERPDVARGPGALALPLHERFQVERDGALADGL
ncbi:MAG: hypothetical protein AVDCRST_MAG10-1085, partial [uncultured Acidimicrobiales bacterium]